jgi:hypothetical protein
MIHSFHCEISSGFQDELQVSITKNSEPISISVTIEEDCGGIMKAIRRDCGEKRKKPPGSYRANIRFT